MTRTQPHSIWNALRADLAAHRRQRTSRRSLEHDLAAYTTAADQLELEMLIERHDDRDTAELRRAVARVRAA